MYPGVHTIDEGTYALLGAASFLGGCMRMTVATCVMLLELTNNLALLPMIMLVTLVAKVRGEWWWWWWWWEGGGCEWFVLV
jgi:chloride channel 7